MDAQALLAFKPGHLVFRSWHRACLCERVKRSRAITSGVAMAAATLPGAYLQLSKYVVPEWASGLKILVSIGAFWQHNVPSDLLPHC